MAVATREEFQTTAGSLGVSLWAISALAAAVEAGIVGGLVDGGTIAEIASSRRIPEAMVRAQIDVLDALGLIARDGDRVMAAPGLAAVASGPALDFLRADLRGSLLQSADMVAAAREGRLGVGWRYEDPLILETQGVFSEAAFSLLSRHVFPQIAGLSDALGRPGARVLDVGSGVGGTAIALCRAFPVLQVVGLDPAPAPMTIARRAVIDAGLSDRIDLRPIGVEALDADASFDLVWLPQVFLDDRTFATALPRVITALKPGGVMLSVATNMDQPGLPSAIARLRSVLIGGAARSIDEVASAFAAAGLAEVRRVATPVDGIMRFAVGWKSA